MAINSDGLLLSLSGSSQTITVPNYNPGYSLSQPNPTTPGAPPNNVVEMGRRLLTSSRDGDVEDVTLLIKNGAPFTTDWLGTSPLHLAAQYGHVETCRKLLCAGISKDAKTKVDKTPLHVAATEGHFEVVELLLAANVEVDSDDMLQMTPLHWAVERSKIDVIELLLKYGANPHKESKFGKTPLEVASDIDSTEIYEMLTNYKDYRAQRHYDVGKSDDATLAATNSIMDSEPVEISIQDQIHHATQSITLASPQYQQKDEAYRLLESKGITFLPEDTTNEFLGSNKLEMTEAGKLALGSVSPKKKTVTISSLPPSIAGATVIGTTAPAAAKKKPTIVSLPASSSPAGLKRVHAGTAVGNTTTRVIKVASAAGGGGSPVKSVDGQPPAAKILRVAAAGGAAGGLAAGNKVIFMKAPSGQLVPAKNMQGQPISLNSSSIVTSAGKSLSAKNLSATQLRTLIGGQKNVKIVKVAAGSSLPASAAAAGTNVVKLVTVPSSGSPTIVRPAASAASGAGGGTTQTVIVRPAGSQALAGGQPTIMVRRPANATSGQKQVIVAAAESSSSSAEQQNRTQSDLIKANQEIANLKETINQLSRKMDLLREETRQNMTTTTPVAAAEETTTTTNEDEVNVE